MILQEQPAEPISPAAEEPGESHAVEVQAPPPEQPFSVADGEQRCLDPRKVRLDRIAGWTFTGTVSLVDLAAVAIVLLTAPLLGWAKGLFVLGWVAVTLGLGWFSHRWPVVAHRHASYKVDGQGIEIHKGVVWRKVINVPRSRVQHTDVSQGPLERRYGLGTLVIYTAGTDHARVDLAGLEHATALRIRDHLLPREAGDAV